MVLLNAETRSLKRAAIVLEQVLGFQVSTNTIERICLDVGADLEAARNDAWQRVLPDEVPVPPVAIVEFDGGRIRTRQSGCGPGVHLSGKGWNETKNAIFVSATSTTSTVDPEPDPPACFLDPAHVAQLTEQAKAQENARADEAVPEPSAAAKNAPDAGPPARPQHRPQRLLRTVLSSLQSSSAFGRQMAQEAKRRRFGEAPRKAFLGDGLTCNWTIHAQHFRQYTPILDFTHAVTYLFQAALVCQGKTEAAWSAYTRWMTTVWRGQVEEVIDELQEHQTRLGAPPEQASADDPRAQLRGLIQYLQNNRRRMCYDAYRREGLPTTTAWMESAVKEINYRVKGTEMFWNNPAGAEAILQIKAAALCDDGRLMRFLTHRPGAPFLRRTSHLQNAA